MTVVEKAAYLKGLAEGLGVESDSKEGKLWSVLTELVCDMAHELEDLHELSMDHADAIDELSEEIMFLEEVLDEDDEDWDDEDEDESEIINFDDIVDEDEAQDYDPEFDGVIYDVTCPVCGEEISFDEDILSEGFIECPNCGERLEFDLGAEDSDDPDNT